MSYRPESLAMNLERQKECQGEKTLLVWKIYSITTNDCTYSGGKAVILKDIKTSYFTKGSILEN